MVRKPLFTLATLLAVLVNPYSNESFAQVQEKKADEPVWKTRLYDQDIKYGEFACNKDSAEAVSKYFKERPLRRILPICHNDCPVVQCRPVIVFPPAAKALRVWSLVSVHVLVGEDGKVLYARVLNGHPLLAEVSRKGACETMFNEHQWKRQGVMHFNSADDGEFLQVPNRANQVY